MNETDLAKDLISLAGGPSIFGVAALLAYLTESLAKSERQPRKAWSLLGAGLLLTAWTVIFIVIAAPSVFGSWTAKGAVSPILVLLTATWLTALVFVTVLVLNAKSVARYLTDSYPGNDGPWLVQAFRVWTK